MMVGHIAFWVYDKAVHHGRVAQNRQLSHSQDMGGMELPTVPFEGILSITQ